MMRELHFCPRQSAPKTWPSARDKDEGRYLKLEQHGCFHHALEQCLSMTKDGVQAPKDKKILGQLKDEGLIVFEYVDKI